jgi:hypothetical protein
MLGLFFDVRRTFTAGVVLTLAACAGDGGPRVDDRFTVHTPIFADNRVYYLNRPDAAGKQTLEALGAGTASDDVVQRNAPLSVILRSVEIPAREDGSPVRGTADYAVILDIGTALDGSSQSLVVWYQRGVQTDQSLNFSNLLVYYEPRWDERVAPYFRIRVMDVTQERNAETRRALERARNVASAVGAFAASPMVSPLIGIAFTAAELVLANDQNRMLVDYSVQLYSSGAAAEAGSGGLGLLKRGSYIVVGRPNNRPRSFWTTAFVFEPESRTLEANGKRVNVPTALITVGTFESIVPKLVLERSAALMQLLASNAAGSTVEQVDESAKRLGASIEAFVMGEKLIRYRDAARANEILGKLAGEAFRKQIGVEDEFFLLRALTKCFQPEKPFLSVQDAETYRTQNPNAPCKAT